MLFKTQSASVDGIGAYLVEVDVGSARMQDFNVVGLPDNAVFLGELSLDGSIQGYAPTV
jgi:hypothetical protein